MKLRFAYFRGWLSAKLGRGVRDNPYKDSQNTYYRHHAMAVFNSNFFATSPSKWDCWQMGFGRVVWKKMNKGYRPWNFETHRRE